MNNLTEFKRLNFFTGFFTTAEDWNQGQAYHLEKRKLHNRGLHTPGIIRGEPTQTGQLRVRAMAQPSLNIMVMPGAAIDAEGNEIYLGTSRTLKIDPEDEDYTLPQLIYIAIQYDDSETDYVENVDAPEYNGYTRITEIPRLEITTTRPDDKSSLELARIQLREGVSAITEPSNPDNPGSNQIDRRHVVWAGAIAVSAPLLPPPQLQQIINLMVDKRSDFAALARTFPVPSAIDVRQAALTLEILAHNMSLRPEQLDGILMVLAAVEQDVGQEIGAEYPVLADILEYIRYQDAVAALVAAIRDGELLDDILNRETEVAEAARKLSEVVLQPPEADAGPDAAVSVAGDEATVTLNAGDSKAFGSRAVIRYHWDRRE